jgi:hypothetical protein
VIHVFMLLLGCALAAWCVWHHLGRSRRARSWASSPRADLARHVLVAWPLVSVALLLGALLGLTEGADAVRTTVSLLLLACVLMALAWFLLPLPVPGWLRPRWYAGADRTPRGAGG